MKKNMFFRLSQKLIIIKTCMSITKTNNVRIRFLKSLKKLNKSKLAISDQPILVTLTDFIKNKISK